MTTIAVGFDKSGRLCMASDSRLCGDYIDPGQFCKVHRVKDSLVGVCGNAAHESKFLSWLKGGDQPSIKDDAFAALVLLPSGVLHYYDHELEPIRTGIPAAIGSGGDFAMAVLTAKLDIVTAVKVAKTLDPETGGRIWVRRLK